MGLGPRRVLVADEVSGDGDYPDMIPVNPRTQPGYRLNEKGTPASTSLAKAALRRSGAVEGTDDELSSDGEVSNALAAHS